ncbi:hypothetical protein AB0L40_24780 [Patulibacter sp. NPDC049589]
MRTAPDHVVVRRHRVPPADRPPARAGTVTHEAVTPAGHRVTS